MRVFFVFAVCSVFSSFSSCTFGTARNVAEIKLVNWNVQTFFDSETAGDEYAEFRDKNGDASWTREKYQQRLKALCQSIKAFDADILALEEIENEDVIHDICNELNAYLPQNKLYPYACFARAEGSAIGCAVLSRFPIVNLTVHQCDSWTSPKTHTTPRMRPLMEVTLAVNARSSANGDSEQDGDVKLFVNHWKSKSGGEDIAAFWQNRQECVLAERIALATAQNDYAVIACGDFNREMDEFVQSTEQAVFRHGETLGETRLDSGWLMFAEDETGSGSYFFRDEWERIDHIFVGGKAEFSSFRALTEGAWAKPKTADDESIQIPFRYTMALGIGYSDHFPVEAVIKLAR